MATDEKSIREIDNRLLRAILERNEPDVATLISQGADANVSTSNITDGLTSALHSAVRCNNVGIVKCLLEHEANVNVPDHDGDTALFSTGLKETDPEIRRLLYQYGAEVNHVNHAGKTPLISMLDDYVLQGFQFDLQALFEFLDRTDDFDQNSTTGNALIHFVSCIHPREDGTTSLENTDHRCVEFLKRLLENNVPFHTRDIAGGTVLHSLVSVSCYEGIQFLLKNNVYLDVNIRDIKGQTVLHRLGAKSNQVGFVKTLDWILDQGCFINDTDCYGRTLLHYVSNSDVTNASAVQTLIDRGADVNIVDKAGKNALHMCVFPSVFVPALDAEDEYPRKSDVTEVIQLLVSAGININNTDNDGYTPLHFSLRERDTKVVRKLLQIGADSQMKTKTGESGLHRATLDLDTFETFLDSCDPSELDMNAQDNFGSTALHWAVWYLEAQIVRRLLELGSSRDVKDILGRTPSDLAYFTHCTCVYEDLGIVYHRGVYPLGDKDDGGRPTNDTLEVMAELLQSFRQTQSLSYFNTNGSEAESDGGDNPTVSENSCFSDHLIDMDAGENRRSSGVDNDETANKYSAEGSTDMDGNTNSSKGSNITENGTTENIHLFEGSAEMNNDGNDTIRLSEGFDAVDNDDNENNHSSDCSSVNNDVDDADSWLSEECHDKNSLFPDCSLLQTIYHEERTIVYLPWACHLEEHRHALRTFVKTFVLDCSEMGLYHDTDENQLIATVIREVMVNAATKLSQSTPILTCQVSLSGSNSEGTKITTPDEFDYKWTLVKFNDMFIPEETSELPLGYARLRLRDSVDESDDFKRYVDAEGYLDGRFVIRDLYTGINEVLFSGDVISCKSLYLRKHLKVDKSSISKLAFRWVGPLYKDMLIEVDVVPAIAPTGWLPVNIRVDSTLITAQQRDLPMAVVLKTPDARLVGNWTTYFRISVAELEANILQSIPDAVRRGYILVKALKDTLFMPQIYEKDKTDSLIESFLTSYILKSCFMHELDEAKKSGDKTLQIPREFRSDKVTIEWAERIMNRLHVSIQNCKLPSFFVPDVNLLVNSSMIIFNDQHMYEAECDCLSRLVSVGTKQQ